MELNKFRKRGSFQFSPFLSLATHLRVELFDLEEVMVNKGRKGIKDPPQGLDWQVMVQFGCINGLNGKPKSSHK